jgi:uncharacterized delta-60 repeat protein
MLSVTRQRPRFRPTLEILEARALLSAGTLDPTFGAGGIVHTSFDVGFAVAQAVAVQPTDDKIVVAGNTNVGGGGPNFALARYNPNGSLDTSFSGDGKVATDFLGQYDAANAVAVQADGKIVAAGNAREKSGRGDFALARYLPNGNLDPAFGNIGPGQVTTQVGFENAAITAMALMPDGRIVVAGNASMVPGGGFGAIAQQMAVARYLPNGTLDPAFGNGGIAFTSFAVSDAASANGVAIQSTGAIVVSGIADGQIALARFTSDGILDTGFGSGGVFQVPGNVASQAGIALRSDNGIMVSGTLHQESYIASVLPDGGMDKNFDADGILPILLNQPITSLAVQGDGKIVAALGNASVLRCNADGTLDAGFGIGGATSAAETPATTGAMTLQPDGKIVEAGAHNQKLLVARWNAAFLTINLAKIADKLIIQGSSFADQMALTADARGVTVQSLLEHTTPVTLTGIKNVWVETGDGNDTVTANLVGGMAASLSLHADFGNGVNNFRAIVSDEALAYPMNPFAITANGGAGFNHFEASFLGSDRPLGGDRLGGAAAPMSVLFQGKGSNDFHVNLGFDSQADAPARQNVYLNTPINVQMMGGTLLTNAIVTYGFNPQLDGPANLIIDAPENIVAGGGLGSDDIRVIYGYNPEPDAGVFPDVKINAPFIWDQRGGRGENTFSIVPPFLEPNGGASTSASMTPALDVNSSLRITETGGGGSNRFTDDVIANIGATGRLDTSIIGGPRSDFIDTQLQETDPASTGAASFAIDARGGDDVAGFSIGAIYGHVVYHADLGAGNDVFHGQILSGPAPSTFGDGTVLPQADINVQGGSDNDLIGLLFGNPDGTAAFYAPLFNANLDGGKGDDIVSIAAVNAHFYAATTLNAKGSEGNDEVSSTFQHVSNDAAFALTLDGGAARDAVSAELDFDPSSRGTLKADVLGGLGNDSLAFNLDGLTATQVIAALIDGGKGIDTASHTANVLTTSIERLALLGLIAS